MPRRQPLPLTFINRAVNCYPVNARADRFESFLLFLGIVVYRNVSHWRRAVPLPVAVARRLLLPAFSPAGVLTYVPREVATTSSLSDRNNTYMFFSSR